jgi:hypothetical protein
VWSTLLEEPANDSTDDEYDSDSDEEEVALPWLPGVGHAWAVQVTWAPDAVIALLSGPFTGYSTFAEVPRGMRVAPNAKTGAAVQLCVWWSSPTGAGYADQDRKLIVTILSRNPSIISWVVYMYLDCIKSLRTYMQRRKTPLPHTHTRAQIFGLYHKAIETKLETVLTEILLTQPVTNANHAAVKGGRCTCR